MTTTTQSLNDGLFESRLANGGGKLLLSREDSLTNRVDVSKNFNLNNNNDSNKNKNLEAQFKAACDAIQSLPKNGSFQPSNEMLLKFYAYYKQATSGPCQTSRPSMFKVVERAKYDAWHSVKHLGKEEAMQGYIDEIKNIIETMPHNEQVQKFISLIGPFYEYVNENNETVNGNEDEGVLNRSSWQNHSYNLTNRMGLDESLTLTKPVDIEQLVQLKDKTPAVVNGGKEDHTIECEVTNGDGVRTANILREKSSSNGTSKPPQPHQQHHVNGNGSLTNGCYVKSNGQTNGIELSASSSDHNQNEITNNEPQSDDEDDYCDTSDFINDQEIQNSKKSFNGENANIIMPIKAYNNNAASLKNGSDKNGYENGFLANDEIVLKPNLNHNNHHYHNNINNSNSNNNNSVNGNQNLMNMRTHDHNSNVIDETNYFRLPREELVLAGSNTDKEINSIMQNLNGSNLIYTNGAHYESNGAYGKLINGDDETNNTFSVIVNKFGGEMNSPSGNIAFGVHNQQTSQNRSSRPGSSMSSSNPYGMDRRAGGSGNPGGSGAGGGGGNGPPGGGGNFPSNDFFFAQDTNRQILLILLRLQQDTNNVLTRLNYLESSVISLQSNLQMNRIDNGINQVPPSSAFSLVNSPHSRTTASNNHNGGGIFSFFYNLFRNVDWKTVSIAIIWPIIIRLVFYFFKKVKLVIKFRKIKH